jgi:hypothetical protein
MLEAQLRQEMLARQRLEAEMAEAMQQREALQAEHEALLAELRPSSRTIERRPSDGSMLRSLLQAKHVRHGSSMSSLGPNAQRMEGWVKMLLSGQQRRGGLAWEKTYLAIRDGVLWTGAHELVSLRDHGCIVWVQPVEPGDLLHLGPKHHPLCFKLRTAGRVTRQAAGASVAEPKDESQLHEEIDSIGLRIAKEERILGGALQLLDAASAAEQQAVAMAHVEACKRTIGQLRTRQEQLHLASSTIISGHKLTVVPDPIVKYAGSPS